MRSRRVVLIVGVFISLVAFVVAIMMYNKPHTNVEATEPAYTISAINLYTAFNDNETEANKKYLGKILEVDGVVVSVDTADTGEIILDIDGNGVGYVRAWLSPDMQETITLNTTLTVKGICTGMLLDVILNDCVLVEN